MQNIHVLSLVLLTVSVIGVPSRSSENNLDLIQLENYPLAQCNDGTTAVYYRKPLNSDQDTKKLMIYLRGGGFCVPLVPG